MLINSFKPIWTVTNTLAQSALGGIVGTSSVQLVQTMGSTLGYANLSEESLRSITKITRQEIDEANLSILNHKLTALEKTFKEYLVAPNSSKDRLNYATYCSQEIIQYLKSFGKSEHEVFHLAATLRLNILLERINYYKDRDEINNFVNAVDEYANHSEALEQEWIDCHNSRFSDLYSRPIFITSIGGVTSGICNLYFDINGIKTHLYSQIVVPYMIRDTEYEQKAEIQRTQIIGNEFIKLKQEILEPANQVRQSWLHCKEQIRTK